MSPTTDTDTHTEQSTRPLSSLRTDHLQLMALFRDHQRRVECGTGSADHTAFVNRIACRLQATAALEREYLFPRWPGDEACDEASEQLDDLLEQLDRIAERLPAARDLQQPLRTLARSFHAHSRHVEAHLLPRLAAPAWADTDTDTAPRHRRAALPVDDSSD